MLYEDKLLSVVLRQKGPKMVVFSLYLQFMRLYLNEPAG